MKKTTPMSEDKIWDVIVVGSGPAGAIAAYQLAEAGLSVLILEKANLPRVKACAGGLTAKARQAIPFDVSPVINLEAKGGMLTNKGKPILRADLTKPLASLVNRDEFDAFLTQQAKKQGAKVKDGHRVNTVHQDKKLITAVTAKGSFSARFLIGADGVNSVTAREMNLLPERETGYAVEAELVVPNAILQALDQHVVFDFGAIHNGYGWIFPKSDHLSVGVCYAKPDKHTGLKDELLTFIKSQELLSTYSIRSIRGHPGPIGGISCDLHRGRCLLAGDAANLADAWMGEGLYYAIQSGKVAAQTIITACKDEKPNLASYSQVINETITSQLYHARRLARIIYALPGLANFLIKHNARLKEMTFDVIRGDMSFETLHLRLKRQWFKVLSTTFLNILRKKELS